MHWLLGAAGVLGGLGAYEIFQKWKTGPVRFIGDKAKVGDEIHIPITSLPAPVPGLPAGAGLVDVKITTVSAETVGGSVIAYIVHELPTPQIIPLPFPIGPIAVPRAGITSVFRGGKEIA